MDTLPPLPPAQPGRYRHYKGGEYELVGVVRHSESLEPLVLYRPLHEASGLWVRPYAMFFEQVDVDGRWQPRFALQDPWLDRWLTLLRERAGQGPVLEIGCGGGDDTATMAAAGLQVHAFDQSASSVEAARRRAPTASITVRDIRAPMPSDLGPLGAVIASLSLHYFPWTETLDIVQRIRSLLRPGGILLCRLNSTQDRHFGARGHPAIEPNFYQVDGQTQRFFDEGAIRALFGEGWRHMALAHGVSYKYGQPQAIWELAVERSPQTD